MQARKRIAVAGATGRVGRHVVDVLGASGYDLVALADLATGRGPAPTSASAMAAIPEIAGPRAENLVDKATLLAARRGDQVKVEGVSDPADPDRDLYENGALLPGPHASLAGPTFEQWLDFMS